MFRNQALPVRKLLLIRGKWEKCLNGIGRILGENRVHADKNGINSDVEREYGRVSRGVKAEDRKRGRKFYRINVVV
jgi:hypothetical protein